MHDFQPWGGGYTDNRANRRKSNVVPIENSYLVNMTREEWAGWLVDVGCNGSTRPVISEEGQRRKAAKAEEGRQRVAQWAEEAEWRKAAKAEEARQRKTGRVEEAERRKAKGAEEVRQRIAEEDRPRKAERAEDAERKAMRAEESRQRIAEESRQQKAERTEEARH